MIESFQNICKRCKRTIDATSLCGGKELADQRTVVSVRLTILGGDVHLAALGRFYSNPSLNIPCENDHRYMANVVSSAIVNKPPPQAIANLLARRNKIHHLNPETDETLLRLFNKDPGDSNRTAAHNQVTMPSRNFAMLTENSPNNPLRESVTRDPDQPAPFRQPRPQNSEQYLRPVTAPANGGHVSDANTGASSTHNGHEITSVNTQRSSIRSRSRAKNGSKSKKDGHYPIHPGEMDCGTEHRAASDAEHGRNNDGGLDICIRVEVDQHDAEGRTESYGLTVPTLTVNA